MAHINRKYRTTTIDSGSTSFMNRLLVFTPTRGTVRMEWVAARYGQIIPTNWSMITLQLFLDSFIPIQYSVADAQNLACKEVVEKNYEWMLMIEDDTMPPPDAFIRFNKYMQKGDIPVVSGLYFTKSEPAEPLVYRGRGNSTYTNWKIGDTVWCDGVPTGMLLIHGDIIRAMWNESEEYTTHGLKTRRVFHTPADMWFDESIGQLKSETGTSDLKWCSDVIKGKFLEKAGFPEIQKKKYPFLVDTNIFCLHISPEGTKYPLHTSQDFLKKANTKD